MIDDEDNPSDPAAYWTLQLELAQNQQKEWLKVGKEVVKRYKSESVAVLKRSNTKKFNILYSNTQVIHASLYGKAAKPDVRRRFGDQDVTARSAAEIIERSLIYCAETYDVDKPIDAGLRDYLLPGRGVIRVEYEPEIKQRAKIDPMTAQPMMGEDNLPVQEDFIAAQKLFEKYVFWQDYLQGPARAWGDVPWIAFRHTMGRSELKENKFEDATNIPLNWQPDIENRKDVPESLKKAEVWEIWVKDSRKRLWIVKGFAKVCRTDEDPYGLEGFWPMPEPLLSYSSTDSLLPSPIFESYRDQADDLDEITGRISRLTKALRRRGVYDQSVKELKRLANAGDNEFIPVENYQALATRGGLEAAFQTEDISVISKVLIELYKQRDMLVQAIYEITGIADIMRGASDPNETLGAQQLKAQFGGTRLKKQQRGVQKWIRDLYKIKAEIIAEHFEPNVLQEMTGTEVTPEVMQLLRSDKLRSYRIDIETDSTILEDAENEKKSRVELVTALTAFVEKWGPVVAQEPAMIPLCFELMQFALGGFKTGKGVEDAIEEAKNQLIQAAQQKAMQPPQPTPEQAKMEVEKAKLQGGLQQQNLEMQHSREIHQMDMQEKGADVLVSQAKAQDAQQTAMMQPQGTIQ